jgi:hypothetical protein
VPATGNVLDNVTSPPGTNETVTGFSVPGSDTVYPAGSTVPVADPVTGLVTGTMQVNPDGSYVFTPAPGFTGPVPAVTVDVSSSDGQSIEVPLTITVNPVLTDASESRTVPAGSGPVKLDVLDNTAAPPGTTVNVTSFTLPGSSVVYPTGPTPVTVTDPVTGKVTGSVVMLPDGTTTFEPAAGFTGQAPAISYTVESSDGQVSPSAVAITVLPGKREVPLGRLPRDGSACVHQTRVRCSGRGEEGGRGVGSGQAADPIPRTPRVSARPCTARVTPRMVCVACAAGTPASAVYSDPADATSTPMDQPVSGNVLNNANVPAGTTAQVTGFSIAGSTKVYPPGANVTLDDPVTGEPIGTLVLSSTGAYTFDPVPGYVGPAPAINVYSKDVTNGQTAVSSLTIDVLPCEFLRCRGGAAPCWLL